MSFKGHQASTNVQDTTPMGHSLRDILHNTLQRDIFVSLRKNVHAPHSVLLPS